MASSFQSKFCCKLPMGIFFAISYSSGVKSRNSIDRVSPILTEGLNICLEKNSASLVGYIP